MSDFQKENCLKFSTAHSLTSSTKGLRQAQESESELQNCDSLLWAHVAWATRGITGYYKNLKGIVSEQYLAAYVASEVSGKHCNIVLFVWSTLLNAAVCLLFCTAAPKSPVYSTHI